MKEIQAMPKSKQFYFTWILSGKYERAKKHMERNKGNNMYK